MDTVSIENLKPGEFFVEDSKMCMLLKRRPMVTPYGAHGVRIDYLKGEKFYTIFTPSKPKNVD